MSNTWKILIYKFWKPVLYIVGCLVAYFAFKLDPLSLVIAFVAGALCAWYFISKKKINVT